MHKRGLGYNASQGFSNSRTDQTEDFSSPPEDDPSLVNCSSLSVREFDSENFRVYPNPSNSAVYLLKSECCL